jgi:hypothetical protein
MYSIVSTDESAGEYGPTNTAAQSKPTVSIDADLKLVGRAFRRARRSGVSMTDAERAALETYWAFHPDVPEGEARQAVARLIKAASEAGLIWMDNAA